MVGFEKVMRSVATALALVVATFCDAPAASAQIGTTVTIAVQPQPWQKRRSEQLAILKPSSPDQIQSKKLDELMKDFEAHPTARTPMENMDILGYAYGSKGIDKVLSLVVMNAALGWYDALRFGSESARAEITSNEGFFKRPLVLAGKQKIDEFLAFAKAHPDELKAAIEQGISLAEKAKNSDDYDHKWPTAYGLERIICAQGGSCASLPSKPESEWPALWDQTIKSVTKYYFVR